MYFNIKKNKVLIAIAACLLLPCTMVMGQRSIDPQPVFHWRCATGDSLMNFHPATTAPLTFDSLPYAEDYTMIVVYKPVADTEATVWSLTSDSIVRGLTTERIISDSTAIRYSNTTENWPVIHTLRQSFPEVSSSYVDLTVGDGNIKVAEVLYFDKRLGNASLRRVQTALAVRYGITLGPVDYIGSDGTRVWNHRRDSALFHHRITGVGNDTTYNLYQLRSRSEMEGGMVIIAIDSLSQGGYLLFGDNDASLVFDPQDDDIEVLARQWRVQATGIDNLFDHAFSLIFDIRHLAGPTDSLVLVVDGNVNLPSAVTANEVRFDNVWLPSDSCTFTLARGAILWQLAQSGAKGAKGHGGNGDDTATKYDNTHTLTHSSIQTFSIFPNPTTGHYNIEVTGAGQVQVAIYNLQGKLMATYNDSNRNQYNFEGTLPSGNVYYAAITTESGSQTMKLIVK